MTSHHITDDATHNRWDRSLRPVLSIESGDTVVFETREASDCQIDRESVADDVLNWDSTLFHPLTGPVYVRRANPGSVLSIEVMDLRHKGWGWTAVSPHFGLLNRDFREPYLQIWELEDDVSHFGPGITVPLQPFCGVMGVALDEFGPLRTIPPRQNGGNMDLKHLREGSTLLLPIWVEGGLFSVGDCHAAQGDGEVTGTGIEAPMTVTLRITVLDDLSIEEPQAIVPWPLDEQIGMRGYYITTGFAPDLMEAARKAIRFMIDHLTDATGLTSVEAYVLCSAVVDLKISELVNDNYVVSAYLPRTVVE